MSRSSPSDYIRTPDDRFLDVWELSMKGDGQRWAIKCTGDAVKQFWWKHRFSHHAVSIHNSTAHFRGVAHLPVPSFFLQPWQSGYVVPPVQPGNLPPSHVAAAPPTTPVRRSTPKLGRHVTSPSGTKLYNPYAVAFDAVADVEAAVATEDPDILQTHEMDEAIRQYEIMEEEERALQCESNIDALIHQVEVDNHNDEVACLVKDAASVPPSGSHPGNSCDGTVYEQPSYSCIVPAKDGSAHNSFIATSETAEIQYRKRYHRLKGNSSSNPPDITIDEIAALVRDPIRSPFLLREKSVFIQQSWVRLLTLRFVHLPDKLISELGDLSEDILVPLTRRHFFKFKQYVRESDAKPSPVPPKEKSPPTQRNNSADSNGNIATREISRIPHSGNNVLSFARLFPEVKTKSPDHNPDKSK